MQELCKHYAKHIQKLCQTKYTKTIQKLGEQICRNNARHMQNICINYAKQNMIIFGFGSCGRKYMDKYINEIYEKIWQRK